MSKIVNIPRELTEKGELVVVPRSEYEKFLKYAGRAKTQSDTWREASREKLLDAYSQSDAAYDEL